MHKLKQINFRLTEERLLLLKFISKQENRTVSNYLETYINKMLEEVEKVDGEELSK